jgi:hypothetical protein
MICPEGQGASAEIASEAVIAHCAFKSGDSKERDQIAVIRCVFQFPFPVTEKAHGRIATSSSCRAKFNSGWWRSRVAGPKISGLVAFAGPVPCVTAGGCRVASNDEGVSPGSLEQREIALCTIMTGRIEDAADICRMAHNPKCPAA